MIRKTIPGVCLCLAFVAFVCASLAAQVPQIVLTQRSPNIQPANGPEAGLTKIYSNLGSKTDAYDDGISYQISGPSNPLFGKGYLAMPFTPAQNSTVKEVLIALGYLGGGLNGGTIGLVTDENGAPGTTPLRTWTASNFPHEGTCCPLVELKDAAGIPLEGGTQYWIVAGLSPGTEEGQYQWNFVWNDATGPLAFLNGNTDYEWLPYTDNLAAFGVYGTTP